MKMTPEERSAYENFIKARGSVDTAILTARLDGKLEGKLEGRLEGKLATAKAMKSKGMDINLIAEITSLSIEEIEKL